MRGAATWAGAVCDSVRNRQRSIVKVYKFIATSKLLRLWSRRQRLAVLSLCGKSSEPSLALRTVRGASGLPTKPEDHCVCATHHHELPSACGSFLSIPRFVLCLSVPLQHRVPARLQTRSSVLQLLISLLNIAILPPQRAAALLHCTALRL